MSTRLPLGLFALLTFASLARAQQKLFTAPGSDHGSRFGASIAILGDFNGDLHPDFIVGESESDGGAPRAGGIQILSGTTGAVIREQFGSEPGEAFGTSVCMIGDLEGDGFNEYVVGAPGADAGGLVDSGRVTLFSGKTGAVIRTWTGAAAGDQFGASLSRYAGGSGFVVGAPGRDAGAFIDAGSVYLYSASSTVPIHEWQGGATGAQLGFCVEGGTVVPFESDGVSPSEIVAGAPGWSTGASGSGRVQIFKAVAPFNVILSIDGSTANGQFGASIAGLNDVNGDGRSDLAIGEPWGGTGEGRAYIVSGATGATLKTLVLPGANFADNVGWCVAWGGNFDGDGLTDVLVGAPFHTVGSIFAAGTVAAFSSGTGAVVRQVNGTSYLACLGMAIVGGFSLNFTVFNDFIACAPITTHVGERAGAAIQFVGATGVTAWTTFGPVFGNHTGTSVADVGDINGDGISDWGVGSPDSPKIEFFSGATGFKFLTIVGGLFSSYSSLAGVGDINLDGIPDFAEGAPSAFFPSLDAGGNVFVFSGSGTTSLASYTGVQPGDHYGAAIAAGGDLDGDGVPDVIIGSPHFANGLLTFAGRVETRSGATGGVLLNVAGDIAGAQLGFSVATAGGDLSGDGLPDVLAGAPTYSGGVGLGRAYVLTAPSTHVAVLVDPSGAAFGASVAGPGDLNGDGKPDLVVGSPQTGAQGQGRVYAYSGANYSMLWSFVGAVSNAHLGASMAAIGDLDLDGAREIAVGESPTIGNATLRIFSGRTGANFSSITEPGAGTSFGAAIARITDVDGDGLDDLLVGAPHSSLTLADAGIAFLYHTGLQGNSTFGTGSPGCGGTEHLVTSALPKVGTPTLQVHTDHVPINSIGLGLISNVQDVAGTDFYGVGALLHVGIIGATLFDGYNAQSDGSGHGVAPFPIPNLPGLAGATLYTQTIWSWGSACSLPPFGLSSSRGLKVTILP